MTNVPLLLSDGVLNCATLLTIFPRCREVEGIGFGVGRYVAAPPATIANDLGWVSKFKIFGELSF